MRGKHRIVVRSARIADAGNSKGHYSSGFSSGFFSKRFGIGEFCELAKIVGGFNWDSNDLDLEDD